MTESEAVEKLKNMRLFMQIEDENNACKFTEDDYRANEMAINALEKQIAKKPYKDNENGVYEKDHCPTCHRSLFTNDHHCECGQAIDWSDEG